MIFRRSAKESFSYSPFFEALNKAFKHYKRAIPSLLLDLDALDHNINQVKQLLAPDMPCRLVVKSLPSRGLLIYLMDKMGTKRLMVFHQPFLSELSKYADMEVDILMGKPMPISTVHYYYKHLKAENGFDPSQQIQWLVDTYDRIQEYLEFAKSQDLKLLLNLEIDVGLHRGGFDNLDDLAAALRLIEKHKEWISFSGFMGYDPHIVKIPSVVRSRKESFRQMEAFYSACKGLVRDKFPNLWHEGLTFNGAGSPTLALHQNGSPLNEVAAGSCFVMPSDFDIDTLESFKPASYIATPILKKHKNSRLPGVEKFSSLLNLWDSRMKNAYFIYGGAWMATLHEPKGVKYNPIFGKSTNQMMVNASDAAKLEVGDFVFLRPTQSEFVFLQFENMITFRQNVFQEEWALMREIS